MNAPANITTWNYYSGVAVCGLCEGAGVTHSHRRPSVDDPYPTNDCECGLGEHEPCCPVCGYNLPVDGYDCLACDTANALYPSELAKFDPDTFAKSLAVAVNLAKAAYRLADAANAQEAA